MVGEISVTAGGRGGRGGKIRRSADFTVSAACAGQPVELRGARHDSNSLLSLAFCLFLFLPFFFVVLVLDSRVLVSPVSVLFLKTVNGAITQLRPYWSFGMIRGGQKRDGERGTAQPAQQTRSMHTSHTHGVQAGSKRPKRVGYRGRYVGSLQDPDRSLRARLGVNAVGHAGGHKHR